MVTLYLLGKLLKEEIILFMFLIKFFLDDCESTDKINFVNIIVDGLIIK
jgi:hypothetical protein